MLLNVVYFAGALFLVAIAFLASTAIVQGKRIFYIVTEFEVLYTSTDIVPKWVK